MNKTINAYMAELERRITDVLENKTKIEDIKKKFEGEIDFYNRKICAQKNIISKIKDMEINAELSDIIKHLAAQWGVSEDVLEVKFVANNFGFTTDSSIYAMAEMIKFNRTKDASVEVLPVSFLVNKRGNGCEVFTRIISSTPKLCSIQKDGKSLGQHLTATSKVNEDSTIDVDLSIDDFQHLILPFKFSELISEDVNIVNPISEDVNIVNPKDDTAKAILDAAEDYRQREQEMTE